MVVDCNILIRKGNFYRGALWNVVKIIRRCHNQDFGDELDQPHESHVSEAEVNKRLSGHEISYTSARDRIIFSANQVGVNRPVEDRWTAYHFGHVSQNTLYCSNLTCPNGGAHYGGTAFTVVDGHGGHACAHAINLLHSDYVVAGLLPPELSEQVLFDLRAIEGSTAPFTVCELSEPLWSKTEAVPTGESEYIGPPRSITTDIVTAADPSTSPPRRRWAPWGIWGPLPASVREVHVGHLRKLIEESLSCAFEGSEAYFADNTQGDICDPEGFVVAPLKSIQEAVSAELSNGAYNQPTSSPSVAPNPLLSHTFNSPNPTIINPDNPDFLKLHDRVAGITRTLRDNLQRLDLDLSLSAQPSYRGPSLDKALLRIVFSGCVATSAYIPCSGRELYVTQVGDCGAVLGSFVPSPISTYTPEAGSGINLPTEYSPLDWKSELLISPHNADNEADVHRLRTSHPVHEAAFVLRDDRLLGELMPLRAFGDIRFKWPLEELKHVARLLDLPPNYPIMPSFYATPPYLSSVPQVIWRPLIKNRDHFLILATDGLWDMLSPKEAVNVVAQHWFDYNRDASACGPGDTAASRLIRTALGGEHMDPQRISAHFSMPATVARYYRDDITVVVVYLPTAALPELT